MSVDERGRVVEAAPITRWAMGQDWEGFVRTLEVRYPGRVLVLSLDETAPDPGTAPPG
jgi:hypothetical protein